jgi:signal transduction histidine kinase
MHFLRISAEQVRAREERLRRFNRMVSHELKNRIGAIRGASAMLNEDWLEAEQTARFQRIISQNGEALQRVLENLTALSRLEGDARQHRNVLLPQAAMEAVRQLRDAAKLGDVRVLVRVSATLTINTLDKPGELAVRVSDNGLGVPASSREGLFGQFFRAHTQTVTGVEGTGLGLSIVKDTIESLGGSTWAEFPEEGGSVFGFCLPSRREEDAAAAGTRRPESHAAL